jgi:drug/metabolite transporter (DMT)-like permease
VALGFHLVAVVPLGALVLATGGLDHITGLDLAVFPALGALGWLSYLTFYEALSIGPISLVSPIVSGCAAITLILAVILNGERLSVAEIIAVVLTFAGVTIASTDVSQMLRTRLRRPAVGGIAVALAATLLFGGFVFGVSDHRAGIGWLAPIFLARVCTAVFLAAHARHRCRPLPARSSLHLVGLIALMDTGGYVCFNLGTRHGTTSVVATASALYAAVPVVIGVWLLHERPIKSQWVGLVVPAGGLVMLGLAAG